MKKLGVNSGLGCCGRWMIVLLVAVGGLYLLLPELRPQLTDASPLFILLLCPLMHLFMHKGHDK